MLNLLTTLTLYTCRFLARQLSYTESMKNSSTGDLANFLLRDRVTEQLGVSRSTLVRLDAAGVTRGNKVGNTNVYDAQWIRQLAERPVIDTDHCPEAVVVRLGFPKPDPDRDTGWQGWHQDWPRKVKQGAARRWWRIARPQYLIGHALLPVVGGFVLDVWNITDARIASDDDTERSKFELSPPTPEQLKYFKDHRLPHEKRLSSAVVMYFGRK